MNIAVIVCSVVLFNYVTNAAENKTNIDNPRIFIIGAGPAGIAAASKLLQNGFKNVTILEAENRTGGRVYTTEFANYLVDLGGQWIHGVKGNPAYDLAAPYGLLDKNDNALPYSLRYFDSQGNSLDEALQEKIGEFTEKYAIEANPKNRTKFKSLGDYVEQMFHEEFKNNTKVYNDKEKYLRQIETFILSLDSSLSWHNISLENDYKEYEGDQVVNWKTKGYSMILEILMQRYPDPKKELPIKIVLDSEVIAIDYLSGCEGEGPPVLLTTSKGQLYKADHVIVTVSLGVLKERHKSLFIPSLPDTKVKTIENLGFGNVAKIFVSFKKPFWDLTGKRTLYFNFVWNDEEIKALKNDTEKTWLLGMSSATTVNYKPNLLEIWVTGESAKAMEELPEDKVFNHTVENLHRFLDKKFKFEDPIAMLRTKWYTNPHFRGTYSYRSIYAEKEKVYPAMLEEPIKNMTVLFAGEATSTSRYSTVDGAISSGWTAADRLIGHYKNILKLKE